MATVHNFLGRDIEIPEDRLYSPAAHFWFRAVGGTGDGTRADGTAADGGSSGGARAGGGGAAAEYEVGVTEPGVALTGGLVDLDVLAEAGTDVAPSEEVAFATTRKAIKYFMSPIAGAITTANAEATAETVNEAPYDTWLFRMIPAPETPGSALVEAVPYAAKLAASEHATAHAAAAAAAAKAGKASPTCRSIYTGIKE
ncbi:MAG: glycine cleavage system protein H [Thermoleophilia bacterium]